MDIFNPMAKAMMQSYQMAMSKGMPPDQAEAYVKSLTQSNIAPLVDLPAMLRKFSQLKQPQVQSPQTQTIFDQVNSLTRMPGRERGLSAIAPQMMAQMPQIAQQAPAMQRGIGGMDAGAMENPRGFNSGGIIAFQEGGASTAKPIVAANLPQPRSTQDIYNYYADIMAQGQVPIFKSEEETLRDIEKERGLGEFAKSLGTEKELLEKQEKRSLEELIKDRENLRRQEAGDIAGAAVGSRSLLEAMAKSRGKAVERERDLEKEIRAARKEREKAGIDLQKAKEQAVSSRTDKAYNAAVKRVENAETRALDAEKTINQNTQDMRKINAEQSGRMEVAKFESEERANLARIEGSLRMGLQERSAQLEQDIKNNTASPEDRLGYMWLKATEEYDRNPTEENEKRKEELFKRYQAFAQTKISRPAGDGKPVDLTGQGPAVSGRTASGTQYDQIPD